MPNHSPISRYLLIAFAALMFGAAVPDLSWMVAKAREWSGVHPPGTTVRTVYVDGVRIR
jgi:hypothetical protein